MADVPHGLVRRRIRWRPCHRIIPSRFPPVNLFARVTADEDLPAVHALESLTNERLREESGAISVLPPADRAQGPGSSYVMAPFAYLPPGGGRFSDDRHGAYYAARTLETSIAESAHHRAAFMRATRERPMHLDMRVLEADLDGRLHDIRGMRHALPAIYDPDEYGASQRLAAALRAAGSDGVIYDSVRQAGGQCVAVFRPRRLRNCRAARHLVYVWDGERISGVYEKSSLSPGRAPGPQ